MTTYKSPTLTAEQVAQARMMLAQGATIGAVANHFNRSYNTILRLKSGHSYRGVTGGAALVTRQSWMPQKIDPGNPFAHLPPEQAAEMNRLTTEVAAEAQARQESPQDLAEAMADRQVREIMASGMRVAEPLLRMVGQAVREEAEKHNAELGDAET